MEEQTLHRLMTNNKFLYPTHDSIKLVVKNVEILNVWDFPWLEDCGDMELSRLRASLREFLGIPDASQ